MFVKDFQSTGLGSQIIGDDEIATFTNHESNHTDVLLQELPTFDSENAEGLMTMDQEINANNDPPTNKVV